MITPPNQEINPAYKRSATRMKMHNRPQDDLVIDLIKGIAYQISFKVKT